MNPIRKQIKAALALELKKFVKFVVIMIYIRLPLFSLSIFLQTILLLQSTLPFQPWYYLLALVVMGTIVIYNIKVSTIATFLNPLLNF